MRTLTQQQIAEAFSAGHFELAYPFFSETIEWVAVGENSIVGKDSVIERCKQTAKYFDSVTTEFKTLNVIVDHNHLAINGTAKFIDNDENITFISACDVYEFNDLNELQRIDSYCITHSEDQTAY